MHLVFVGRDILDIEEFPTSVSLIVVLGGTYGAYCFCRDVGRWLRRLRRRGQ